MKALSGIVRALTYIVAAILVPALLIGAPILMGYRPMVVLSGSMEPAYPTGSITWYKKAGFAAIQVGDTITMRIGEASLATHRVIEKDETAQSFTTKGDANPSPDNEPVPYARVMGKTAAFKIPFVGFAAPYIMNAYAIVIMVLVLVLDLLLGNQRKKNKSRTRACDREWVLV